MVVIDWLQTCDFVRANSERFVLYCLCGCFLGITIILLAVLVVLYLHRQSESDEKGTKIKSDYQIPRTDLDYDILSSARSYLPVYRYDGRNQNGFYNV